MHSYLFSINFFKSSLLALSLFLLFYSSAIASDIVTAHKNTEYISKDGGYIICTKSGVEKLYDKRHSQIENNETVYTGIPRVLELVSNEEGCYFEDRKVVFLKIAEEYALPIRESLVIHEDGEENCYWAPEKRCKLVIKPAAKYVEAAFLGEDRIWRKGAFIEMGGNFKLLDRPEEPPQAEEDRTPDALLKTPAE